MNKPTHFITEVFIISDLFQGVLSAMLAVEYKVVFSILNNLDDRLNTDKTSFFDLSIQVKAAYKLYLKYMEIIDSQQFNKYVRTK